MATLAARKPTSVPLRRGAEDPVRSVTPMTVSTTGNTSSRLAFNGWPFMRDHST